MYENQLSSHEANCELINNIYSKFNSEIDEAKFGFDDEIYGDLPYYSVIELINNLDLESNDILLDIGSGFGNIIFSTYLIKIFKKFIGVEINSSRFKISKACLDLLAGKFCNIYDDITLYHGDFLNINSIRFEEVSVVYVCCTVFSIELIEMIGEKIDKFKSLRIIISFRKIPTLKNFTLHKRIFLQASYDRAVCYIYHRK